MKCPFGCKIEEKKWMNGEFMTISTAPNMEKQVSDPPNWIYRCPVCGKTKTAFKKEYYASPKKSNPKAQSDLSTFFPKAEVKPKKTTRVKK